MRHENGKSCERCSAKLTEACTEVQSLYYWVKSQFPQAHVSWTFRDQANQEEAFRTGKSKLHWPHSRHNVTDKDGRPAAEALDFFVLTDDGQAVWPKPWFQEVANKVAGANLPFIWGGNFKKIGDFDHWELNHDVEYVPVSMT